MRLRSVGVAELVGGVLLVCCSPCPPPLAKPRGGRGKLCGGLGAWAWAWAAAGGRRQGEQACVVLSVRVFQLLLLIQCPLADMCGGLRGRGPGVGFAGIPACRTYRRRRGRCAASLRGRRRPARDHVIVGSVSSPFFTSLHPAPWEPVCRVPRAQQDRRTRMLQPDPHAVLYYSF